MENDLELWWRKPEDTLENLRMGYGSLMGCRTLVMDRWKQRPRKDNCGFMDIT